ncbi:hypothetical protein [Desulfonema magnum]|uniref:Uncharacterized protein n=1 Tax=Desulfonema magnum TaxID=45655 RepID=A0A975BVP4_9BACT|nr:hypothetical protein [Desulfonema magnum]QTA92675.1 Uncharacterized protein dnm_087620 [Desulfonema magnum]
MFRISIEPFDIRSRTPQARFFWQTKYKPLVDKIKKNIFDLGLSVLIWANANNTIKIRLHEINEELRHLNIDADICVATDGATAASAPNELKDRGKDKDIIIPIIIGESFLVEPFLTDSSDIVGKLSVFLDTRIIENYEENRSDFKLKDIFQKTTALNYPNDFKNNKFNTHILYFIEAIRTIKYMQSVSGKSPRILKSNKDVFLLYKDFKPQVDIFLTSSHLFLLSFLRYLNGLTKENFLEHLNISKDALDSEVILNDVLNTFENFGLIKEESDRFELTNRGNAFFELFGLTCLPVLEDEKKSFKEKWSQALEKTFLTNFELCEHAKKLEDLSKRLYLSLSRKDSFLRWWHFFVNKYLFDEMTEAEEEFWNYPITRMLFEIWRENISDVKQDWRAAERERTEFIEYVFEKLRISNETEFSDIYQEFKNLIFSMSMLRPNNQAHIYLCFSFQMRPLKNIIRQYFDIAVITGQYDLLLKRYSPYHHMLNINATHGQRIMFDLRLDFRPVTFRLDHKFTLALELSKAETRKKGRYITCPVVPDQKAENDKLAEISEQEKTINNIFPSPDYLRNINFGDDGKVYYTGNEEKEVVEMYGQRRTNLIQKEDELNLIRATPRPSPESGLILRFNLLDPVAVLLEGINRGRDVSLDEFRNVMKCLDLYGPEAKKSENERRKLDDIIDEVFEKAEPEGLTKSTLEFLHRLQQICNEDSCEEEMAWRFLISKFMGGYQKHALQAICHRLTKEGLELVFSLWPLVTGNEIKINPTSGEVSAPPNLSKTLLPFTDNLRRELQDLLKNVFTQCLYISAPTIRARSEPRMAEMVIRYCLNIKSNEENFRERLKDHLEKHYQIHYSFMEEYRRKEQKNPGQNKKFEFTDAHIKQIQNDVSDIVALIEGCRKRLFSPGENNRLLCFIDPDSVDVQIGKFEYEGKVLDNEEAFRKRKKEREKELGEFQHQALMEKESLLAQKEKEITKATLEKERQTEKAKIERLTKAENWREKKESLKIEQEEIEMQKEMYKKERELAISEVRKEEIIAFKEGDMQRYLVLALLEAHLEGGLEKVWNILESSSTVLMIINPDLYQMKSLHELKRDIFKRLEKDLSKVDPITLSILLSDDHKKLVETDIYKEMMKVLSETLKNIPRHAPFVERVVSHEPKSPKK